DVANFDKFQNQLSTTESLIINRLTEIYNNYIKDTPTEKSSLSIQQSLYEEWIELTTKEMRQFATSLPKKVKIILTADELKTNTKDKLSIRWFKFRNRLLIKLGKETIYYNLKLRKIFHSDILPTLFIVYFKNIQHVSNNGYAALVTLRSLTNKTTHIFHELKLTSPDSYDIAYVKKRLDTIKQLATQSGLLLAKQKQELFDRNSNINVTITNSLVSRIDKIHPNVAKYKTQNEIPSIKKQIATLAPAATATYQCKQMLINNLILNNTLLITKNRITIETLKIKKTIEQEIRNKILVFQYDFKETLTKLVSNSGTIENDDVPILKEIANNQTKSDFGQIDYDALNRAHRRLKHWIETFPAELELLDEESYNNLTNNKFGRIGSIKIATKPLINFMVDREYIEPIKQLLSTIPERISSVNKILSNYVRLIDYSNIGKTEVSPEDSEQTDLFSITDLLNELNAEIVQSEQFLKKTIYSLESTTSTITGKLDVYPFLDAAQNIRQYIREKRVSSNRTGSLAWVKNSLRPAREQFAKLILSQSKGILFTRSFFKEENTYSLPEKLMAEYQQSHIKPEVQKKLSFYYKHLFVGKQNYALDFLIGREEELKKIDNYIVNHRSGFRNALLIAGERHSGKTFLANVMADKYVERKKVFIILPPEVGSTNFNDFNLAVGNAFNNSFNAEYNFSRVQNGTMIIVENAELWWAKENGGEKTLTTILNLTQKYRNSIVFVFTINSLALGIIKNVVPINRYFSSIVECSPMNASQIGKVILNRHNIGNMRFVLNGKRQHHFRTWNYAKLFNRYFLISDGNIGYCLNIWINNILSVNNDKIQIQTPKLMDNSVFGSLSAQQKLVLLNIIIHTSVTVKILSQLLKTTTKIAEENLNELQTLGLVVRTSVGVYKIDSIAHHRIVRYFKHNNII
ncbi:MAG: ATP-binding protein, partial [Salinivirgaceae bacterium]|nr:ATP-binding protein [Salinivirgaceae bacterium]